MSKSSDVGLFVLRLALGGIFIAHGVPKAMNWEHFVGFIEKTVSSQIGLPAVPLAGAVLAAELGGGALLILGVFTRFAALALALVMAAAIYFIHLGHGFYMLIEATEEQFKAWPGEATKSIPHGFEYNIALLAMALTILFTGGGKLSLMPHAKEKKKK